MNIKSVMVGRKEEKREVRGELFLKMEVGRTDSNPLRDCYEIGSDICRMVMVSDTPGHDICYIAGILDKLWDQHKTVVDNKIGSLVLKVND